MARATSPASQLPITAKPADPALPRHTSSRSTKTGWCSRADARSIGPSTLPSSTDVVRSVHTHWAVASCHSWRARSVPVPTEWRRKHVQNSVLWVVPASRHAVSAAERVVASHRALHSTVLPIEGARTYAPAISTGAVAVFRAFQPRSPARRVRVRSPRTHPHRVIIP